MGIRGMIEGGGSFELTDEQVATLRKYCGSDVTIFDKLAAALPPEPYVPQVGDKVRFQYESWGGEWSMLVYEYRGVIDGQHVIRNGAYGVLPPTARFKRAEVAQ